jgi:hypothetical protein
LLAPGQGERQRLPPPHQRRLLNTVLLIKRQAADIGQALVPVGNSSPSKIVNRLGGAVCGHVSIPPKSLHQ